MDGKWLVPFELFMPLCIIILYWFKAKILDLQAWCIQSNTVRCILLYKCQEHKKTDRNTFLSHPLSVIFFYNSLYLRTTYLAMKTMGHGCVVSHILSLLWTKEDHFHVLTTFPVWENAAGSCCVGDLTGLFVVGNVAAVTNKCMFSHLTNVIQLCNFVKFLCFKGMN